jgi:hypothetical protein
VKFSRIVLCALLALSAAAVPAPSNPKASASGGGIVDVGGGAGGGTGNTGCTGSNCNVYYTCYGNDLGRSNLGTVTFGYRFPGCYGYTDWTPELKECLVRYEVWRFYGTTEQPVIGTTVSKVHFEDPCANRAAGNTVGIASRIYYPLTSDWQTSAAVQPYFQRFTRKNVLNQTVAASNNCTVWHSIGGEARYWDGSRWRDRPVCKPTTLPPFKRSGANCSAMHPNGAYSVQRALNDTDANVREATQLALYRIYVDALQKTRDYEYAALWAGLPVGARPTRASDITSVDVDWCASAVSFMGVYPQVQGDPNNPTPPPDRVVGACVAAVSRPARIYNPGGSRTLPQRPAFFNPAVLDDSYDDRYSSRLTPTALSIMESPNEQVMSDPDPYKYNSQYRAAVYNEVRYRTSDRPGGDYWPDSFSSYWKWYGKGNLSATDAASSARRMVRCFSQTIPAVLPKVIPENCELTNTCDVRVVEEPGPEGVLHVALQTPQAMRVGGTLRPSTISVRSAALYCGAAPCAGELAPRLTSASLAFEFTSNSGRYRACTALTARNCEYYIERAGSGTDRSLQVFLFSPTNRGESLTVGIKDTTYSYDRAYRRTECRYRANGSEDCVISIVYRPVTSDVYRLTASPTSFTVLGATAR